MMDFNQEMNDSVEFKNTGYYGFCLEKKISKRMLISLCAGSLDKPKLYIKKRDSDTYHIIPISCEVVEDLLAKSIDLSGFTHAC
jgi:hypothetical protein